MSADSVSRDTNTIPIALVDTDPTQPRQWIDPAALTELTESIGANGLAVPILVRPVGDRFVIVHGERRYRSVVNLGWSDIPAEVRDIDAAAARWLQLVENINRADLSPIEEARAYRAMLDTGETQLSLAKRIGKDRSYIAQKLRLLMLPASLTLLTDRGALSEGHVRQLLRIRGLYTDKHAFGGKPETWTNIALTAVLIQSRPEDWPPGYPHIIPAAQKHPILKEAATAWAEEISTILTAGSRCPYWTVPAFYFAALTVAATVSVASLSRVIDCWIERIYAALLHTRDGMLTEPQPDPASKNPRKKGPGYRRNDILWWGHRSDLRHAGLDRDNAHLDFLKVAEGALNNGSVALPSECQPGAPRYDEWLEIQAACVDMFGE